ncbi:hypothetical protein KIPB_013906 [Kipferlia bialata]|uniref:Uncharacterized protein n=1 Tax=Kipferlia bialata TaxID=797122 RepID=A0A9K3GPU4_9EUKA|nr:hypothetical protein KIPB_013906 [Kipferlia bialata]|eukprot:g13906.t1
MYKNIPYPSPSPSLPFFSSYTYIQGINGELKMYKDSPYDEPLPTDQFATLTLAGAGFEQPEGDLFYDYVPASVMGEKGVHF